MKFQQLDKETQRLLIGAIRKDFERKEKKDESRNHTQTKPPRR